MNKSDFKFLAAIVLGIIPIIVCGYLFFIESPQTFNEHLNRIEGNISKDLTNLSKTNVEKQVIIEIACNAEINGFSSNGINHCKQILINKYLLMGE